MNKVYYIIPAVLTVLFTFYFFRFSEELEQRDAAKAAEVAQVQAEAAAKKKEAELRAKEDADRRTAEREADEARRLAEREANWERTSQEIADITADLIRQADELTRQANALELQLANVREKRDLTARESFDLERRVEEARVRKRNAEMEIQRYTEMVSQRASRSAMTGVGAVGGS